MLANEPRSWLHWLLMKLDRSMEWRETYFWKHWTFNLLSLNSCRVTTNKLRPQTHRSLLKFWSDSPVSFIAKTFSIFECGRLKCSSCYKALSVSSAFWNISNGRYFVVTVSKPFRHVFRHESIVIALTVCWHRHSLSRHPLPFQPHLYEL